MLITLVEVRGGVLISVSGVDVPLLRDTYLAMMRAAKSDNLRARLLRTYENIYGERVFELRILGLSLDRARSGITRLTNCTDWQTLDLRGALD